MLMRPRIEDENINLRNRIDKYNYFIPNKLDIAMVIHEPLISRDSELVITCYSEFNRADVGEAPGPFGLQGNADANAFVGLGSTLEAEYIQRYNPNFFGNGVQIMMDRGSWVGRMNIF